MAEKKVDTSAQPMHPDHAAFSRCSSAVPNTVYFSSKPKTCGCEREHLPRRGIRDESKSVVRSTRREQVHGTCSLSLCAAGFMFTGVHNQPRFKSRQTYSVPPNLNFRRPWPRSAGLRGAAISARASCSAAWNRGVLLLKDSSAKVVSLNGRTAEGGSHDQLHRAGASARLHGRGDGSERTPRCSSVRVSARVEDRQTDGWRVGE